MKNAKTPIDLHQVSLILKVRFTECNKFNFSADGCFSVQLKLEDIGKTLVRRGGVALHYEPPPHSVGVGG